MPYCNLSRKRNSMISHRRTLDIWSVVLKNRLQTKMSMIEQILDARCMRNWTIVTVVVSLSPETTTSEKDGKKKDRFVSIVVTSMCWSLICVVGERMAPS